MDARTADAMVYTVSGVCEFLGLLVTILDLRRAANRLATFLESPPAVTVTAIGSLDQRTTETFGVDIKEDLPRDEQLAALRSWARGMDEKLRRREGTLWDLISKSYGLALTNTYKTFMGQWRSVRGYLAAENRGWFRRYIGPALIFLGIALGILGNLLNLYVVPAAR